MNLSMPESHEGPRLLPSPDAKTTAVANSPRKTQSLDYVVRSGLAGGLAGCAAKTLIAPLDRVKILFQASSPQYSKYAGSWFGFANAVRSIYSHDGFWGLFRGHSMTLFRVFPYAAIKFIAYEQYRAILIPTKDHETVIRRTLSGSLAGVSSVFFTYPLEVARVRLAFETKKNYRSSAFTIFSQIYHEPPPRAYGKSPLPQSSSTTYNLARSATTAASAAGTVTMNTLPNTVSSPLSGLANFYRGFLPTLLGMLPYAGGSFFAYDVMGDLLRSERFEKYCVVPDSTPETSEPYNHSQKSKLRPWAQLLAGGFAGLIGQTASYPLEIIRRRMQVAGAVGDGRPIGVLETARLVHMERGIRGFYVGLSIGFIKVVPMVA
ncbi:Mitoferrin [Orbilia brochopaga]|nr:Mitoferrin [Drechslerella brochopaga]